MWLDRVSNPGPLTYEPGALLTALRGPAIATDSCFHTPSAELQWVEHNGLFTSAVMNSFLSR